MKKHISDFGYKNGVKNVNGGKCRECSRKYAKWYRRTHPKSESLSSSRLYGIWRDMLRRCENHSAFNYSDYGGRGIKVYGKWHDFREFEKWATTSGYSKKLTLDRINNDDGYSPVNCRWATPKEQSRNRRNTKYLEFNKSNLPLAEWADIYQISRSVLYGRIYKYGWDAHRALTTPVQKYNHNGNR